MAPEYRAARHEQDAFFKLLIGATRAKIFRFLQSGALHNISTRGLRKLLATRRLGMTGFSFGMENRALSIVD